MFVIDKKIKKLQRDLIDIARKSGSIDSYEMMPGRQAYIDGMYMGVHDGYVDGVNDLRSYLMKCISDDPDARLSDILQTIIYTKK